FFTSLEGFMGRFFTIFIPLEKLPPGSGIIGGIVLVFIIGLLLSARFFESIFNFFRKSLKNVPLVKTLYSGIEDMVNYFGQEKAAKGGHVVIISVPGISIKMVGLMTRESMDDEFDGKLGPEYAAVFIPFSYAWGGNTIFVPREWITKTNMPVSEMMKAALTAWMQKKTENQ
ncbi:MAG: DUF502 domain-containing protein, partial [Pseudomonadota bacterium]